MNKNFGLYREIEIMGREFNDIRFIKKRSSKRKILSPDDWIRLNDTFNRFVNHRRKPFKKIKDGYMIL